MNSILWIINLCILLENLYGEKKDPTWTSLSKKEKFEDNIKKNFNQTFYQKSKIKNDIKCFYLGDLNKNIKYILKYKNIYYVDSITQYTFNTLRIMPNTKSFFFSVNNSKLKIVTIIPY